MKKGAVISDCGLFRYRLWRIWDVALPICAFGLLNPSTADSELEDPTSRRVIGFAKRLNCGGAFIFNLYAYRATKPADLIKAADPVGPLNDRYIAETVMATEDPIILGYGAGNDFKNRGAKVRRLIAKTVPDKPVYALGLTKDGHPRHPLYLRKDAPLTQFEFEPAPTPSTMTME